MCNNTKCEYVLFFQASSIWSLKEIDCLKMKIIYLPHCFLSFMKHKQNNGIIMSKMCFSAFFSEFWVYISQFCPFFLLYFFISFNSDFFFPLNSEFTSRNSDFYFFGVYIFQCWFFSWNSEFTSLYFDFSHNYEFISCNFDFFLRILS